MKKKILIATTHQFGYHSDYFYWCFFLKDEYEITYLTFFHSDKPEILMDDVNIVNVPVSHNFIKNQLNYLKKLKNIVKNNIFDNIIVTEQLFSSIIWVFVPKSGLIFDIRSVAVFNNKIKRFLYNFSYYICTKIYPYCTGITQNIADSYNIDKNKFSVLPLGSNILSNISKDFNNLNLLYIGCLRNGFEETIVGFSKFHESHPDSTYTIIGFNANKNVDIVKRINEMINTYNLKKSLFFLGQLQHKDAIKYFDNCNVGVSYIPITSYFDKQPPTKNYEYMLSGMVCLATATNANKTMINNSNGILVQDNANSFAIGLSQIWENRFMYNSIEIRSSQNNFTWKSIVENKLKVVLLSRAIKN